jgi:hypothetical protein
VLCEREAVVRQVGDIHTCVHLRAQQMASTVAQVKAGSMQLRAGVEKGRCWVSTGCYWVETSAYPLQPARGCEAALPTAAHAAVPGLCVASVREVGRLRTQTVLT